MACLYPLYIHETAVSCGKCPACLVRRADDWIFRIMQEEKHSDSVAWLCLTYDDWHVPRTPNGLMTLRKRDVQLFMKRLRKLHPKGHRTIKYYLCGEYGTTYKRPHYHVILLNANVDFVYEAWTCPESASIMGEVYLDHRAFTPDAIAYTVGYMNKRKVVPIHYRDDREKEFSLMSKKMGLSYLTPAILEYHRADFNRNFVTLPGGKRSALPRYFVDRIYNYSVLSERASVKELRAPFIESAARKAAKAAYVAHINIYGNADDFIRSQSEARFAAVLNFQKKSAYRKD